VLQISSFSSSGTSATAFKFGRVVDTRTSFVLITCLALLGASLPKIVCVSTIRFVRLSIPDISTYLKGKSGVVLGSLF